MSFDSINPSTLYLIMLLTHLYACHICHVSTHLQHTHVFKYRYLYMFTNYINVISSYHSNDLIHKRWLILVMASHESRSVPNHLQSTVHVYATAISCWQTKQNRQWSALLAFRERNPVVIGEFPSQRISNAESVSMSSWHHHVLYQWRMHVTSSWLVFASTWSRNNLNAVSLLGKSVCN